MKALARVGLALFCLQAAACLPQSRQPPEYAEVAQVIDGDTIELSNGERVRYLHIDTPELRKRVGDRWVYAPEPFAEEAKRRNQSLVEGRTVRLEYDVRQRDRFGRLLAYVYVGERMVNRELVREGLADLMILSPNLSYAAEFRALRKEAREARLGLWNGAGAAGAAAQ